MQIEYELTQKDFTEAFAAHRNRNVLSKWIRQFFVGITGLIAAIVLFGLLVRPNLQMAKGILPFFGLGALWLGGFFVLQWRSVRRQFLRQPGAHGPRTVLLDASGAHWRWNGGSSDVEWKNYIRLVEGKNQFLFYTSPACFNILPKCAMKTDQLSEIREMLKQRISAAK